MTEYNKIHGTVPFYGRPEWQPFWYIQYEPERGNEAWNKYHRRQMMWPMKCFFTSDPSNLMTGRKEWANFKNRHTPNKAKMWKKLYIGRKESSMFPMEWRLLFRVPADINNPPDDFDPDHDIHELTEIDMDAKSFLFPPDRDMPLDELNAEEQS